MVPSARFSGACTSKRGVQQCIHVVAACKSLAFRIRFLTEIFSFRHSLSLLPTLLMNRDGVVSLVRTLFNDAFLTTEVSV
jgi:hypothetical protein